MAGPDGYEKADTEAKMFSLFCAVVHFGLGNLSQDSVPPRPEKILEVAAKFEEYLDKK